MKAFEWFVHNLKDLCPFENMGRVIVVAETLEEAKDLARTEVKKMCGAEFVDQINDAPDVSDLPCVIIADE
ncbi:MAG: hypothetical protein WC114_09270 [Smithellaceae bacterium]|jgi:hypothetical protein